MYVDLSILGWFDTILTPICSVIVICILFVHDKSWDDSTMVVTAMIFIINIYGCHMYEKVRYNIYEMYRIERTKKNLEMYYNQTAKMMKMYDKWELFRDSACNRYILMSSLLQNHRYEVLENEYTSLIGEKIEKRSIVNSGNIFIDSVIGYKTEYANSLGISINLNIRVPLDLKIIWMVLTKTTYFE